MKDSLVSMDKRGTGRVRLSDFYGEALETAWRIGRVFPLARETGDHPKLPPGGVELHCQLAALQRLLRQRVRGPHGRDRGGDASAGGGSGADSSNCLELD